MNIFILSDEATWAKHLDQQVQFMCDRHIVKMIAESTQMLVTALHNHTMVFTSVRADSITDNLPCAPLGASMTKHPCTEWTMASPTNFNYLAVLALAMCYEHQHRYPLSPQHAYMPWLQDLVDYLSYCGMGLAAPMPKLFAIAVKDSTKRTIHATLHEAVTTYRDYYVRDKHRFATWKRRAKPMWFLLREEELVSHGRL